MHDLGLAIDPIVVATIAQLDAAPYFDRRDPAGRAGGSAQSALCLHANELAAFATERRLLTFAFNPAMVRAALLFSLAPRGDDMVRPPQLSSPRS